MSFLNLSLLCQNLFERLSFFLGFLLLFLFFFHLDKLLYFHALFDIFFTFALFFGYSLLFKTLALKCCKFILLQPGISKVVLLLTLTDSFAFFSYSLMCFQITLATSAFCNFIKLLVSFDKSLSLSTPLISSFSFSLLGSFPSLLPHLPVLELLPEASLRFSLELIVSLLSFHLPIVVLVSIHTCVINKHIFTIDDGNSCTTATVLKLARMLRFLICWSDKPCWATYPLLLLLCCALSCLTALLFISCCCLLLLVYC